MNFIKKTFDKARPAFSEGGRLKSLRSVFEGFESFLLVSNATSRSGASIHDAIDSKRIMSIVVIALMPAML
ncbi:MAG: NADH:ubiquinone reductase (Na(+)-transporting) subunit B, partial [Bacteroidales bacterium]|nr:NADH:ubiquinone reductase (Na(+)-transporting) subunit B [Bacteroidales bacterium]